MVRGSPASALRAGRVTGRGAAARPQASGSSPTDCSGCPGTRPECSRQWRIAAGIHVRRRSDVAVNRLHALNSNLQPSVLG
jgi:hypothetical protein